MMRILIALAILPFIAVDLVHGDDSLVGQQRISLSNLRQIRSIRLMNRATATTVKKASYPKVCKGVRTDFTNVLWKSQSSAHLNPRDARSGGCTLIYGRRNYGPRSSCLPVYDSRGVLVAKLGLYQRGGEYGARYYTGVGCAQKLSCSGLGSKLKKTNGNRTVYIGIDAGLCRKVTDIIGRTGGV